MLTLVGGSTGHKGLTPREAEVLGWIGRGKTNSEIASLLYISPHTIRKHIENIFEKLKVHTRTAAALYARRTPITDRGAAGQSLGPDS